MTRFLGYTIPKNKKTVTKRGAIKKKGDTPQSPRQIAKRRPAEPDVVNPIEIPQKKKRAIPLSTSGARMTPPKSPTPETNAEGGSVSFQGFIPEVSPNRGVRASPSFHLRDETSSEASHNGCKGNHEEQCDDPFFFFFCTKHL
jgi:hypothetical protein